MNPSARLIALPLAGLSLGMVVVGASVISLAGSDSTPYEGNFFGVCYSDVTVEAPLSANGDGNNLKVREVIVTGDFQRCNGQTILLTAELNGAKDSYAFFNLTGEESSIVLTFSPGQGPGDWHSKFPRIVNGRLVAQGPLTPPPNKLTAEEITWVIDTAWD